MNKPTFIEYQDRRFLICDRPTDSNLPQYLDIMKKKNVVQLVRACEPSYDIATLNSAGISVMELPFADGDPPPADIVSSWLDVVNRTFAGESKG